MVAAACGPRGEWRLELLETAGGGAAEAVRSVGDIGEPTELAACPDGNAVAVRAFLI